MIPQWYSSYSSDPPSPCTYFCFFVLVCHRCTRVCRAGQRETALSHSADLLTGNQAGLWDRPARYCNKPNLACLRARVYLEMASFHGPLIVRHCALLRGELPLPRGILNGTRARPNVAC